MAARTRVLMVIKGLAIGDPLGGAERFGLELALSLDQDLFEPAICALWRHNSPSEAYWVERMTQAGIAVFFAADSSRGRMVTRYAGGLRNIARHFQRAPVDIVHSHVPLAALTATLLRRRLGARVLVRTALAGKEWGDGFAASVCRQIFTNWVFPFSFDAEACVSQSQANRFDRRPGARLRGRRSLWLPNAIRLNRFSAGRDTNVASIARRELGFASDDLIVGSVGRLSREKGYGVLVEAAALLTARRRGVKFLIIGDGPLREELRARIEQLGLADAILLTGARTDVDTLYGVMDLFVLPSFWEGLPTVILESMASRVPVVATDIPGTRELVTAGRTGWLAHPGDPSSLAETILEALDNPAERAQMADSACQEIVPRFSIEQVARQYEKLYLELLREAS
jgi:glycosyltransferase involved in cell wall biosynthesis